MGSSASKTSRAAGSAARHYPTRPPVSEATTNKQAQAPAAEDGQSGPTVRPQAQASNNRTDAINLDASDPDFARSLRSIGPVQPNPTLSSTSTFPHANNANAMERPQRFTPINPRLNPAITVLDARARLQDEADREFMQAGKRGHEGRQYLDVLTIRQMLTLRDERGKSAEEIERSLGLRKGVMERLGPKGLVGLVQETGRARKEVDIV